MTAAVHWNGLMPDWIGVYGFEVHFIRGLAKMQTRVGLALAVMMALALASIRIGHEQRMRSLVEPVPLADTG